MVELLALAVVAVLALGVYVFTTFAGAQSAEHRRRRDPDRQEDKRVRLLQAEIAHLEDPSRIERLSTQYLGLQPVDPSTKSPQARFQISGPDDRSCGNGQSFQAAPLARQPVRSPSNDDGRSRHFPKSRDARADGRSGASSNAAPRERDAAGAAGVGEDDARLRIFFVMALFCAGFLTLGLFAARASLFSGLDREGRADGLPANARADLVDRNGEVLAMDLVHYGLYVTPRDVSDAAATRSTPCNRCCPSCRPRVSRPRSPSATRNTIWSAG